MAETIKKLIRQRVACKGQVKRIHNNVLAFDEPEDVAMLDQWQQKLEGIYQNFERIHSEIESLADNLENEAERDEFETAYYKCSAEIRSKRRALEPVAASASSSTNNGTPSPTLSNVQSILPEIKIRPFNGNYAEWNSFYDMFRDLVHNNDSLPTVHKFHRLRSYLQGDAATVIDSLNATEENYNVAWNLLQKRFNKPRKIIRAHVHALFELPEAGRNRAVSLETLVDKVEMHLNALKSLGHPIEGPELIIYIVAAKIDKLTREHWERSTNDATVPTVSSFLQFLRQFSQDSDPISLTEGATRTIRDKGTSSNRRDRPNYAHVSSRGNLNCPICQKNHFIQYCKAFLNLEPKARKHEVDKLNLCPNCLRPGHALLHCKSISCRKCNKRHNTLLHFTYQSPESNGNSTKESAPQSFANAATLITYNYPEILLSTARIIVLDDQNRERECRALLDPGSQSNFMTESLAKSLNLKLQSTNIPVSGLGGQDNKIKYCAKTTIKSRYTPFTEKVTFLVLQTITGQLPLRQVDQTQIPLPANLKLADPSFHNPASIDVLLGEYLFYKLLCTGQIRLPNDKSLLQKTQLGWVISGEIYNQPSDHIQSKCYLANCSLDNQLAKFWELEECSTQKHLSDEATACEQHYQTHTYRDAEGRYVVRLPFNNKVGNLGDSYTIALKRFYSLERRLEMQGELRHQYQEFIAEYLHLGHMTACDTDVTDGFYLPHHPVLKATSSTTKLRVVFDASAKTTSGLSLNDTLLVGPTIQDDLFQLVVRFRLYNYVLTADIEKMFRQIKIHLEDTRFQKILWRANKHEQLKTYKLNTVAYGTASAPFLAVRTLKQLAIEEAASFPLAAEILARDFYMDDLLTGAQTISQAIELRDQLIQLLRRGGFHLRQWASNGPSLVNNCSNLPVTNAVHFNASETKRTLGICWDAKDDVIFYKFFTEPSRKTISKRNILFKVAQLIDPLGLLGPIIISAKLIMQELWKAKIGWDEPVTQEISINWLDYLTQLSNINQLQIPRKVLVSDPINMQLHGFSDAGEKAYGACIYLRSIDKTGKIITNLICAKSRVAPLKSTTLPRLELCGAVWLTRLYQTVMEALTIKFDKVRLWTDSMIVLHWLRNPPHTLKTFVANRVAEIQSSTQHSEWSHVSSTDNPADYLSRGQPLEQFTHNRIWFNGPSWLSQDETTWHNNPLPHIDLPEKRSNVTLTSQLVLEENHLFHKFSSFAKLNRIVAYCLRFRYRLTSEASCKGELRIEELTRAQIAILKQVQIQAFPSEVRQLLNNKTVNKDSKLYNLSPYMDQNNIIRAGGRLKNADIPYDHKYPIILPKSHPVTYLIILQEHIRNMHAGIQATLNSVRQRYWPVDGRNGVRYVIRKCIRCFKAKPTSSPPYLMGDLPRDRVAATRAFEKTGIDYCGPLFVKEKRFRNQKRIKVYVAVYICFFTKAVHLELVSDLTTEAFLASLRRFIARRGRPKGIYSDNGTNFIGAKRELADLYQLLRSETHTQTVTRYSTDQSIVWHLSPPSSPHFGGLWEAAVKSFKHHFIRTVGDTRLTYEQLNTYIIEIEGILNSRPLTPLSPDPNDFQALTPAHFLIGEPLTTIPENNFIDTPSNRLSIWEHLLKIKQHFWNRWHKEYLNELRIRSKWKRNISKNLQVGDLVLIRDELQPSIRWPLGRVIEVYPGVDGVVRVVTVRTPTGSYKRSVKKLCPLPSELF